MGIGINRELDGVWGSVMCWDTYGYCCCLSCRLGGLCDTLLNDNE